MASAGKQRSFFKIASAPVLTIALLAMSPLAQAAKNQFFPSVQAPVERGYVGDSMTFSLGFFFSGISPAKTPFAESETGATALPFRYQVPSSLGLEASFALLSWLELGVSAEYIHFTSGYYSSTGNANRKETISYRAFPIFKGIARGIWNLGDGFALESELGAGTGKGKVTLSSSDPSFADDTNSIKSFVGHLAVGAAFMWDSGYSLHTSFGYGTQTLPYHLASPTYGTVVQDGNFNGPFAKVMIRYQF